MVVIGYPDLFVVEKSEDLGTSEFTATLRAKQVSLRKLLYYLALMSVTYRSSLPAK